MGDHTLTSLSLVCRRWQPITEAKIYRQLRIRSRVFDESSDSNIFWESDTHMSYKQLVNILTPTRLSYVRQFCVTFSRSYFPARFEEWRHDCEFGKAIRRLFDLLSRIPHAQEPQLDLQFVFYSSFGDSSWSRDTVEPTPPDELPKMPMVRSFYSGIPGRCTISPQALLYMASNMPRLRELNIVLSPIVGSIHQRIELARLLAELPLSIHNFSLRYPQRSSEHSVLAKENGEDILMRELRRFSQRQGLERLTFYGWIEPSILWPPHSGTSEPRQWPTLKSFVLHSHDNAWNMNALIQALAKCSARMPKAEYNSVDCVDFFDIPETSLTYCTMSPEDPCVKLYYSPSLELDEELVGKWRKTAEANNLDFQMRVERRPFWLDIDPVIIS